MEFLSNFMEFLGNLIHKFFTQYAVYVILMMVSLKSNKKQKTNKKFRGKSRGVERLQ